MVEIINRDIEQINKKVRKVVWRMKNGKAVGSDDVTVEAWNCLGEMTGPIFKSMVISRTEIITEA